MVDKALIGCVSRRVNMQMLGIGNVTPPPEFTNTAECHPLEIIRVQANEIEDQGEVLGQKVLRYPHSPKQIPRLKFTWVGALLLIRTIQIWVPC